MSCICGRWFVGMFVMAAVSIVWPAHGQTQCPQWTPGTLETREDHAMAYDSARAVIVMFGGRSDISGLRNDTWEWNGERWERKSIEGPTPRAGHSMAYDAEREVTVLFGGQDDSSNPLGDTWEWDGAEWTRRAVWSGQNGAPQPRWGHALAFDEARGVTVMFGGQTSNSRFGSTWEWNGSAWTLRSETGPFPRFDHAMCWHAGLQRVVLFGGNNLTTDLNDLWQWNGSQWSTLGNANTPTTRRHHAMIYDDSRQKLVLVGGYRTSVNQRLSDTWEWQSGSWGERAEGSPGGVVEKHAMAFDSFRARTVLLGGRGPSAQVGPTWGMRGPQEPWAILRATGAIPRSRFGHVMTYDSIRDVAVMFGGQSSADGTYLRDLWEWDGGDTWIERTTLDGPSAAREAAMSFDSSRGVSVLFGGFGAAGTYLRETWEWNGQDWVLRKLISPPPRYYHGMTYDSVRQRTVMFGGIRPEQGSFSNELWEYDGSQWVMAPPTGPGGLVYPALTFDAMRGTVWVIHQNGQHAWGWNGVGWTPACCTHVDIQARTAYDSQRGITYMYPYSSSAVNEWDGSTTRFIPSSATGPGHRYQAAMVYHERIGRLILFGGQNSDSRTWEYQITSGPAVTMHPENVNSVAGLPTSLTVSATGTASLRYQWRRDSMNLANGGHISGATTATLGFNPVMSSDAGTYDCVVTNACSCVQSNTATLTVGCNHSISLQPQAAAVTHGGTAQFTTTAAGIGPYSYQWRKDSEPLSNDGRIAGANTPTMTIEPVMVEDAGSYDCITSGPCATVGTVPVALSVICDLTITEQPVGMYVYETQDASFSVAAVGFGGVTYQWRRNKTNLSDSDRISGTTSSTLTITEVSDLDAGDYDCVVSSPCGAEVSDSAPLGVSCFLQFATVPMSQAREAGQTVEFTAAADSIGPVSYRWIHDLKPIVDDGRITGSQEATLIIRDLRVSDAGEYKIAAINPCATLLAPPALLGVQCSFAFTDDPEDTTTAEGFPLMLSVAVQGHPPLVYQWRHDETELVDDGRITGSTTPSLTITRAAPEDAGDYDVIATSPCGTQTSIEAHVDVRPACSGDASGDGMVNFVDITAVLTHWGMTYAPPPQGGPGDASQDGAVNFVDITAVLTAWGLPCK